MHKVIHKIFRGVMPALVSAAILSACGGGDTAIAPSTLSGTAAVGLPIVGGTVNVTCAGGSALATTTSNTGIWQVTMSGQTLPCAVQVSGGQVGGTNQTQSFHSIATTLGVVNVTPLTDLVVANLTQSNPQTWFTAVSFTGINTTTMTTALNNVSTAFGLSSQLGSINPFTAAFQAQNGDTMDDILEAFRAAITAVSSNYTALLTASSSGNFSGFTGFGSAFTVAYSGLTGGTNNGGGSVTCGASETALVYSDEPSTTGYYTNGQQVCFSASTTTLSFAGKTLSNPVSTGVAYKFTDINVTYEVVFNNGQLHEINVLNGSTFEGKFAKAGGANTGSGSGTLTIETSFPGFTAPPVVVTGVQSPISEADFCNAIQNDSSLTSLTASGGTLTITGCSYSGNVGTISANLVISSPFSLTTPYTVKYTYS